MKDNGALPCLSFSLWSPSWVCWSGSPCPRCRPPGARGNAPPAWRICTPCPRPWRPTPRMIRAGRWSPYTRSHPTRYSSTFARRFASACWKGLTIESRSSSVWPTAFEMTPTSSSKSVRVSLEMREEPNLFQFSAIIAWQASWGGGRHDPTVRDQAPRNSPVHVGGRMMKARKLVGLCGGLGFIVAILAVGMHAAPAAADDPSPSVGPQCPWPCKVATCGQGPCSCNDAPGGGFYCAGSGSGSGSE